MKLLFCPECWDMVKLAQDLRSCACGDCVGKYLADDHHAVTNGRGYCLAINNHTLVPALMLIKEATKKGLDIEPPRVDCCVRAHGGLYNPRTTVDKTLSWQYLTGKRYADVKRTTTVEEMEGPEKAGLTD